MTTRLLEAASIGSATERTATVLATATLASASSAALSLRSTPRGRDGAVIPDGPLPRIAGEVGTIRPPAS
jgi:hypothetical protein